MGGDNSITVRGTEVGNDIVVNRGATTTVTVAGRETINMVAANTDHLIVEALGGDDNVLVAGTGGPDNLTVDLGGPTANDTLSVTTGANASVTYGTDPASGVIGDATNGNVNFAGTEIINLTGAGGGTLTINGTNAADAINQNDNSVTVNNGAVVNFSAYSTLTFNGLGGSDEISLSNTSQGSSLTSITVNAGDPTAGSDTVVVNGTSSQETINFSPTSIDAGTITGAGPVPITLATTEHLIINGQGGNDLLTVTTPAGDDVATLDPGAVQDQGSITIRRFNTFGGNELLGLAFENLGGTGTLTFADPAGLAGTDSLIINGHDSGNSSDQFTVAANGNITLVVASGGGITRVLPIAIDPWSGVPDA